MRKFSSRFLFNLIILSILIFVVAVCVSCTKSQPAKYKVVIVTLLSHPALDQIPINMKEELKKKGYTEGKNVEYLLKNANGDMQLVSTIANEIKAFKPSIVVAITTPVAQAISKTWDGLLVFSAVTDPVGAGIMPDWNTGKGVVTGVSDMWPYKEQIKLMREISKVDPFVKTII